MYKDTGCKMAASNAPFVVMHFDPCKSVSATTLGCLPAAHAVSCPKTGFYTAVPTTSTPAKTQTNNYMLLQNDNNKVFQCEINKTIQRNVYFDNGQFQDTVFSRFCYVLLCNHEYIHCLNHRQAKDYITRRNETGRKLKFERRHCIATGIATGVLTNSYL